MLKKITAGAIALLTLSSGSVYGYDAQLKSFGDITNQDWAIENVYTLSAFGIIDGYPDGDYHPEAMLSREAFIKLLVSTAKLDVAQSSGPIPGDVASDRWSYNFIATAYHHHWIDFMLNASGELRPEQPITREEVATIIGKYLAEQAGTSGTKWIADEWSKEQAVRGFTDDSQVNASLAPFVYYTINRGVMEGDDTGFHPTKQLTRREAAAVINRLIDVNVANHKLEVTGFYAIKSSPAMNRIHSLDHVVMGWSHLEYITAGTAKLDMETTEYKVPDGFESVVKAADQAHVGKDLMIYTSDGTKLAMFLKDVPAQKMFLDQLKAKLSDAEFGFTGVCVDLEGLMNAGDAPNYLNFIRDLKAAIGSNRLTIAVPTDYNYKGYDFKGLGETADTIILMAYDFTHDESRLPSAPLPLVSDAVERALQSIPADKLVLGISKEAIQWLTSGNQTTMYKPGIDKVEERAADPKSVVFWNMPYFLKQIHYQDGGSVSDIYYEDSQSIAKKIWLAKAYGLRGVSLWYMGNFTASDWEQIAKR